MILQLLLKKEISACDNLEILLNSFVIENISMRRALIEILVEKKFEFNEKLFENSLILSERNFNCEKDNNYLFKSKVKNSLKGSEN